MSLDNNGDQDGDVWRPAESDVSIRPGWFYHPGEDDQVRTVDNLVDLYFQSVGRNSLLLLNVPPTPEGLFHETDVQRLIDFRTNLDRMLGNDLATGAEVRCIAPATDTAPQLLDADPDSYWTADVGLPVALELHLPVPRRFGVVLLQEPVAWGQRIAAHRLDGFIDGQWRLLAEGTTVGYKRLHRFGTVELDRVRLTITASRGQVALSRIAIFAGVSVEA